MPSGEEEEIAERGRPPVFFNAGAARAFLAFFTNLQSHSESYRHDDHEPSPPAFGEIRPRFCKNLMTIGGRERETFNSFFELPIAPSLFRGLERGSATDPLAPRRKARERPPATVADLMKTAARVYLANAFSCVHLQGETVSCG
jgi:hypothetical protein